MSLTSAFGEQAYDTKPPTTVSRKKIDPDYLPKFHITIRGSESYVVGSCCAIAASIGFAYDQSLEGKYKDAYLNGYLEQLPEVIASHEASALRAGKSIMFCTVNTQQLLVEQVLIKMGYKSTYEDWAYRDPKVTLNSQGVKIYTKLLYTPVKEDKDE